MTNQPIWVQIGWDFMIFRPSRKAKLFDCSAVGSLNCPIWCFSSNVLVTGTDVVIASTNDSTSASAMPVSGSAVLQQGALDSASAVNRKVFPDTCRIYLNA